jgi:hypothetical protein
MILIALFGWLTGATLGTRLRVFVLLPVSLVGGLLIAAVTLRTGSTGLSAAGDVAAWTICLQIGYLGGLLTRYCLAATRLKPGTSLSSTVTRS